jgi:hypothetical protein
LEENVLRKSILLTGLEIHQHKRFLGIFRLCKISINEEMVREGCAWAYREYLRGLYVSKFINAEKEAREKKVGLWQQSIPWPPCEIRRGTHRHMKELVVDAVFLSVPYTRLLHKIGMRLSIVGLTASP